MYAYDTAPGRRSRDVPPSSSSRYRDTGLYDYAQPARSSKRYQDPEPVASAYDRHRRKSVPVSAEDERRPHRRASVVASDDGRGSRDVYGSAYPERTSRHDVEVKTSDRDRRFRDQRRGCEAEEAANLKRAKSYSPRRAAREADLPRNASPQAPAKSAWADDGYYSSDPYRSSAKKGRGQQYYDEDVYAGRGGSRDRGKDYLYGSSPAGMPRPPAGDYAPYKSSPLSSSSASDEKLHKQQQQQQQQPRESQRGRDKPAGYSSTAAYPDYEPYEPPRRARSTRVPEQTRYDGYGYGAAAAGTAGTAAAAAAAAPSRGRDRPLPTRDYDDPYDHRTTPRGRQRQSVPPPQARSRYADDDDINNKYGAAPPPRRAASVNQGRYGDYDAPGRKAYTAGGGGGGGGGARAAAGGGATKTKQKTWGKQAGKLFMTHAVPVIKNEAVPFLTKAAQAYMEQKRR